MTICTPKTDAVSAWFMAPGLQSEHEIVFADFARSLERANEILREQLDAEIRKRSEDSARLDWLRHHVSGKEFCRIGICMVDTGDLNELRQLIDGLQA